MSRTHQTPVDVADVPSDAEIELVDPEAPWLFARMHDWITLHPNIDHTAYRVYAVFVGLATKQSQFRRRLTKDAVRYLVPGARGKPMKTTAFNDALRGLSQLGLVEMESGSARHEQVRSADGTFRRDESFRWRVRFLPPDQESFEGYRNVHEKLADYPGPGWDTDGPQNTWSHRGRNSGGGGDQPESGIIHSRGRNSGEESTRCDQGKQGVSAGHTADTSGRNSDDPSRNSGEPESLTCKNQHHPDSPSHTDPSPSPYVGEFLTAREGEGEGSFEEEHTNDQPPTPAASAAASKTDTKGAGPSGHTTAPGPDRAVADTDSRSPAPDPSKAAETAQRPNQPGVSAGQDQDRHRAARLLGDIVQRSVPADLAATLTTDAKHQLVALVLDCYRSGIGHAEIRNELEHTDGTRDLAAAWPVKLQSLIDTRQQRSQLAAACGRCEARPDDPVSARLTADGARCDACHPNPSYPTTDDESEPISALCGPGASDDVRETAMRQARLAIRKSAGVPSPRNTSPTVEQSPQPEQAGTSSSDDATEQPEDAPGHVREQQVSAA